jgi:hypothetical protein
MNNEIEWSWPRPHGKPFKIILNMKRGILEVFNDRGETIIRKTNLTKRQIDYIFNHLQNRLDNHHTTPDIFRPDKSFDPMIA